MISNLYCVSFYIIIIVLCCIENLNGQTEKASNITETPVSTKPATHIYQTDGFNSTNITSGPILLIDKKTMFISNINYEGDDTNAYFWVGTKEPSSDGQLVPDEDNSVGPLKSYKGQNIYLQLPGSLTIDKIDYISVWSMENKTDLGHVNIYKNSPHERNNLPEVLGHHKKTAENKTIFRIPSCCDTNEIFLDLKCTRIEEDLKTELFVWESNETHIDPDRYMQNIEFVPYYYNAECREGYVGAELHESEIYGLIFNSSLLYYLDPSSYGILPHGSFCIVHEDVNRSEPLVFACISNSTGTNSASVQYLYFPFLVISTLCFLASALVYIFLLKETDVHRRCFIGYSVSMTVTFITLIFLQKLDGACCFMGTLFMFSMLCSFVWLACLCLDLFCVVTAFKCPEDKTRVYFYITISVTIPLIIVGSSLIPDGIPDVPKSFVKSYSGTNTCSFGEVNLAILFIPIGLLILISVIGLGYTSYIINTQKDPEDPAWVRNRSRFKFMLIQNMMLCIIVTISYIVSLVLNLLKVHETPEGILASLTLLQYMQGLFIVFILFGHNWGSKVVEQRKVKKNKSERSGNYEMTPLNGQRMDISLMVE